MSVPPGCPPPEEITRLLLDLLDSEEASRLTRHVTGCRRCTRELGQQESLYQAFGASFCPPIPATPSAAAAVRSRLIASAGREVRLGHHARWVADELDIDDPAALRLLASIDDPALRWRPGPAAGIEIHPLDGGPRRAGAYSALLRMSPGAHFPEHRHIGPELLLVLQGQMLDGSGALHPAGAVLESAADSHHQLDALPGPDLICLVIAEGGVAFGDRVVGPRRR